MKIRILAIAALLSLVPCAGAGTLTVGPPGSGAGFNSLAAAVIAAAPGDVLVVQGGTYDSVGPILIEKSLTILGAGSENTLVLAGFDNPAADVSALQIKNLAPGDRVRVTGLTVTNSFVFSASSKAVVISNCDGAVVLSDIVGLAGLGQTTAQGVAEISDSVQVSLDNCEFKAPAGALAALPQTGFTLLRSGLYISNSTVNVNRCTLYGADSEFFTSLASHGGAGLRAIDSDLRIATSQIRGGIGVAQTPALPNPSTVGDGGAAVELDDCSLVVSGGAACIFLGGDGGSIAPPLIGFGGAAISMSSNSTVVTTSDSAMFSGTDSDGTKSVPSVDGAGTHTALSTRLATLYLQSSVRTLGNVASVRIGGEPSTNYLTFFSPEQGHAQAIPGVLGDALLDLGTTTALAPRFINVGGFGDISFIIPAIPALAGTSFLFQGINVSSTVSASLGSVLTIQ